MILSFQVYFLKGSNAASIIIVSIIETLLYFYVHNSYLIVHTFLNSQG